MPEDHMNDRRTTCEEAMHHFLDFVNDPLSMDEDELDEYLENAGLNFAEFDDKLTQEIETSKKRARLIAARESRKAFVQQVSHALDLASMTLDEKRTEIQQRLGHLDGQAAKVFNRNYEDTEDEEDIDGLLEALRELDARSEENGHAG